MYIDDESGTAPVRRRIIQQPLRTESPVALIVGDKSLGELEARLKQAHPLITSPSISHFLSDPPRREPWRAIVVARSGAWDPRFDRYVRRRSDIALFGLEEESFGWPESVSRVRDLTELEPWLVGLDAPDPVRPVERAKRQRRTQPKSALLTELTASLSRGIARTSEPSSAASPSGQELAPQPASAPVPSEAEAEKPASVVQLELPGLSGQQRSERAARRAHPAKGRAAQRSAAEKRAKSKTRSKLEKRAKPEARKPERRKPETRKLDARSTPEARTKLPPPRALPKAVALGSAAELEFARLASELGLLRAMELLGEIRQRASGLRAR